METKRCVLYDRVCIECGECNMCDLDPTKVCDNCGKCIGLDHTDKSPEYRAIKVDGIIDETMNPSDYLYDEETLEVPTRTTISSGTIFFRLYEAIKDKYGTPNSFAKSASRCSGFCLKRICLKNETILIQAIWDGRALRVRRFSARQCGDDPRRWPRSVCASC